MSTSNIHDFTVATIPNETAKVELSSAATAGEAVKTRQITTKATRGNGPAYRIIHGKRAIYRGRDLVAWAEPNTAPLRYSTSEVDKASMPGTAI